MRELEQFKVEFNILNESNTILHNSKEVYNNLTNGLNFKPFEAPDIIIPLKNKIIGMEVFEFSSYSVNKKGDSIKQEENKLKNKNYYEYIRDGKEYFISEIETDITLNNYVENFIRVFDKHYMKIDNYINNLNRYSYNLKKEIYFLVKDTTIDGNTILFDNNLLVYYPLMNKEICEFLKDKYKVKGLIFESKNIFNNYNFFFFKNTKENLIFLKRENEQYFNIELIKKNHKLIQSYL